MFLAKIRSAQAICVFMLAVGISLSPAWAATFVVDTNSDVPNLNQQPGRCGNINPITDEPMAGTCTLRSALDAANSLADSDIIEFGIADDTISLSSELLISSSVTIDNSAADIVVDGHSSDPRIPDSDFRFARFAEGEPLKTPFPYVGAGQMR